VEDEGDPLGGRQCFEHDEEREADRVCYNCFALRVHPSVGADDWLGDAGVQGLLAAGLARAQHVETDACDDGRQPAAQVGDIAGVRSAETEPAFLNGVVGFTG